MKMDISVRIYKYDAITILEVVELTLQVLMVPEMICKTLDN